jgi:ATP-dependent DNA helicase RecQ
MELYKFEVANEAFEPVIKGLLRIYGGELYTHFHIISEKKIAIFLRMTVGEVERKLTSLHNRNVIYYDKKKDTPQITFTTPRYDASKLPLDAKHLEERRRIDLAKAESVINYVTSDLTCRSVLIQDYFGESATRECGLCDYCINKSLQVHQEKYDSTTRHVVYELISQGGKPLTEVLHHAPELEKERWIEVIREMLDTEELYYDEEGWLHLAGKEKE